MTITVCCSANFYKQAVELTKVLEKQGFEVLLPSTALRMSDSQDFDVTHYKTWFGDAKDYHKKTALMKEHFDKVTAGDATLVLNYDKHGIENYIGGNVLMEMALAFHSNKPIFILNELPVESSFIEEVIGLNPTALHGKIDSLIQLLGK